MAKSLWDWLVDLKAWTISFLRCSAVKLLWLKLSRNLGQKQNKGFLQYLGNHSMHSQTLVAQLGSFQTTSAMMKQGPHLHLS